MPENPPLDREIVALAVLLADIVGGASSIAILNEQGRINKVETAFRLADEFIAQIKE